MRSNSIPLSTYRLQFNGDFTFAQAAELVPYLAELGISHCYASPYLRARPGSLHGYDIIDHRRLNPEIGTPEDYRRFVSALEQHGMGQILDVVPNHMGIMGADNAWWLEVLENGEASTYAEFFDIDWYPLKDELQGKVLVPVLGDQYGIVLERGELKLTFERERGEFSIFYFQHRFPVNPREYPRILGRNRESLQQKLAPENQDLLELESLISAFNHLPGREETASEKRTERLRDKEIHKRRLSGLCARSPEIADFIEANVASMNGRPGDGNSFDSLHELIKAQGFRLAYWRVAADDINYRRFFDVNDLGALRQENEAVFKQTHEFVLELLRQGTLDGLRIDHPDGLYDPKQYFERLQASGAPSGEADAKPYYLVAEKILSGGESLSAEWPVHGTTGYNFSNLVNGVFVDRASERKLDRIYRVFVGQRSNIQEIVYRSKKRVMDSLLNSELNVLANHLSRIALGDRHTCDFTVKNLRDILTEVVACFPVYRTYVTQKGPSESDRRYINQAVDCAKERTTVVEPTVYEFIREVLLTTRAQGHQEYYRRSVFHFAMRFQQYTSAVMAKGLEDTSFYRYNRLVSLNDVGADPLRFGVAPEEFHREIASQAENWPHEMRTISTHDSKRSADVRARINVLSEMPVEWYRRVRAWRELNRRRKGSSRGEEIPTLNDEYLFYQTLIGAWPLGNEARCLPESFRERIASYMLKAVREAKDHTSWANPNAEYEDALKAFVMAVVESQEFRQDFLPFEQLVSFFGMLNSLAQTLIQLTVPGVPDTYQGNEFWEFALVDPDNRRAVDYGRRREALGRFLQASQDSCRESLVQELTGNMEDGRIKLYVVWKTLNLRKQLPALFRSGEYVPLKAAGGNARHIMAFARRSGPNAAVIAVPRLSAELWKAAPRFGYSGDVWSDTRVEVPGMPGRYRNLFTCERIAAKPQPDAPALPAAQLFEKFPVALLISES